MLKLTARFGVWYDIEDGIDQIDTRRNPNRARVGAEQRSGPLVLIEQSPDRETDDLGLVAARELLCRPLYQGDDVGPVDGDHLSHIIIHIMIDVM
jgi:hypothetical protein